MIIRTLHHLVCSLAGFLVFSVALPVLSQTTVINDSFDDGNLATNAFGTGSGWVSIGQTGVSESGGFVNLNTAGNGTYSTMVAQASNAVNPFQASGTAVTFRFGTINYSAPWQRFWVGYRLSGASGNHFYPDAGTQGLFVSVISNTGTENNYTYTGNLVAMSNSGVRTILASWNWSDNSQLSNLALTLTTTSTTYALAFADAVATPTFTVGAASGPLSGMGTLGGNFVPGVHNQYSTNPATGGVFLDSVLLQTGVAANSAPTVATISPATGSTAGGTSVTITGANFTGATGVTIGGAAATNVSVVNATTITATTPAGIAGTASVVVTTPGGSNAANTLYTFVAPVTVTYTSATDVAVTAASYTATGNTVNFTLSYAPTTGTNLTVVNNTGLGFISGVFDNLAQGQAVTLSFGGDDYEFVANYYGGTGNDLVLQWADTRAFAWGANFKGQLGDGSTTQSNVPGAVSTSGLLSGKTVIKLASGGQHSLALCSDGTLVAWGLNDKGQLGNGNTTDSSVPVAVDVSGILSGKTVIAIAAGSNHSLALCSDGTVAAWGSNSNVQLGYFGPPSSSVPVAVNGVLSGKTVIAVGGGELHSLALFSDGTMAAWGGGSEGQVGDGAGSQNNVPVLVSTSGVLNGKTVISIATGTSHNLALCSDGTLVAWGYNGSSGTLGINSTTARSYVPVLVSTTGVLSAKTVTAISAGREHSLVLCSDGTLAAWGRGTNGQLGNNATSHSLVPVLVNTAGVLSGKTVTAVQAGGIYSMALCSDGALAAWGYNGSGNLGDNSVFQSAVPVLVSTTPLAVGNRFVAADLGVSSSHSLGLVAPRVLLAPTLTSLDITSGSSGGGTSVTLTGTYFTGATSVTFGGVAAASFTVVDDNTITAVTPAGGLGSASVVVTTAGGSNAANTLYTYTNSAPSDITLTPASIAENNAPNASVGTLAAVDEDVNDSHTFTLVAGTGDTDNGSFTIDGTDLKLTPVTDFETKSSYSLRVQADDGNGGTYAEELTVTVTDVNDAPVITSNGGGPTGTVSVAENTTSITTVAATDADLPAQTLTYSKSGTDASFFTINSSTGALAFAVAPNFEIPLDAGGNNVYNVTVTATDNGTGTLSDSQDLAVTVTFVSAGVEFGGGSTTLTGSNPTTGPATLGSGGTLILNRPAGDNTAFGTDGVAGNTDITISGGTLQILQSEQIGDNAGIVMTSGDFNFGGVTGLTETFGTFSNSGGTFVTGDNTLIGTGASITWSGGTNTVSDGGLVQDAHITITGGTNTVEGGATGGVLEVLAAGAGLEFGGTANPTLTLNSDNAVAGKLLLSGDVTVLNTLTSGTALILSGGGGSNPGTVDLNGGTRTFTINDGSAATDLLISAPIINGALSKAGAGTLRLSGTNTYTGNTSIQAGTLSITGNINSSATLSISGGVLSTSGADKLANAAAVTVGGGTLTIGGDDTVGSLVLTSGTIGGSATLTAATYGLQGGTVDGNLGAGTINSSGNVALNGTAGATTVNISAGTLTLGAAERLDNSAGVNLTGGTLAIGANNEQVGVVTLTSGSITGSTGVLTGSSYAVQSGSVSAILGGTGVALTKTTAGTVTLSGANTYTGNTSIQAGTLSINAAAALGGGGAVNLGVASTSSGTLTYTGGAGAINKNINALGNGTDTIENAGSGLLTLSGTITKNGTTLTLKGGANGITVSGAIGGASANSDLIVDGGIVTLAAANTYNGPTFIRNSGTLNANAANALPTANGRTAITFDGAGTSVLNLGGNQAAASLASTGAATVNLNANILTVGAAAGSVDFAGSIGGTGGFTKDSASTQILSGSNGYSGTTTISAGTLSITGDINSSATLAVNGGLLSTSGANKLSNTAAVTVGGGTLTIGGNDTIGSLTLNSGTIGGTATLTATTYGLGAGTVDGNLGAGTLNKNNFGTVTLNGTSAADTVNISLGNLSLGSSNRLSDTATVTVSNTGGLNIGGGLSDTIGTLVLNTASGGIFGGGTLTSTNTIDAQEASTVDVILAGSAGLTKTTAGAMTLSRANTYTGTTTVSGGTLSLGTNGRLSDSSSLVVSGGIFAISNVSDTVAGVQLTSGSITGTTGVLTSSSTFDVQSGSVSAILAGSMGLTKTTGGTVTLSGVNSYSGTTTVSAGTLSITGSINSSATLAVNGGLLSTSGANKLANTAAVTVGGGTLTIGGADTVGSLVLTSGTIGGTATLTAATYGLQGGLVDGNLGAGTLTKSTGGTVTLNGTAAAATVNITAGTLTLGANDRLANGATVTVSGTGILDVSTRTDTVSIFNISAGSLNGSGTLTATTYGLSGGTVTANLGAGTLNSSGNVALNGTAAATTLNITAGTLTLGANDRLANGATVTVSGTGILDVSTFTDTVSIFNMSAGSLNGSGTLTATTYGLSGGTVTANLGTGTINSSGNVALNGTAAATTVNISAGTLTLGSADRLADGATVSLTGGTLAVGGFNDAVGGVSLTSGSITGSGGVLTSTTTYSVASGSVSAILGGTVGLTKTTGGTVTLSGVNTYTGATTISAGTLALSGSGALSDSSAVNVNGATGVFDISCISGAGETIGSLAGVVSSSVVLGAKNLTAGGDGTNTVFAGGISGTGSLTKAGTGTLTLNSANGYSGLTTVSAGILNIQNATGLGTTAAGTSVSNGATLQLQGGITVGAEALTLNGGAAAGESGALVNVSGTNSFGGAITVAASSSISATGGSVLNLTGGLDKNGTVLTFNGGGTINVSTVGISGAAANSDLVVDGVTVNLDVANTYNGPTFIRNTGTLNANVAGALPTATRTALTFDGAGTSILTLGADQVVASLTAASAGTITLNTNTLTIGTAAGSTTFAGSVGGTGGLTKDGASTQILSNSNGYTGATTISAGTLTLSGSGALSDSSAVNITGATGIFDISGISAGGETIGSLAGVTSSSVVLGAKTLTAGGDGTDTTFAGVLSGTGGSLTKTGVGTLTLNGTNTFDGVMTLSAGTLRAESDAAALGAGTLALNGGTLELVNDGDLSYGRNTTVGGNTKITVDRVSSSATNTTMTLGTLSIGTNTLTIERGGNITSTSLGSVTFGDTTLTGNATVILSNRNTLTLDNVGESGGSRSLALDGTGGTGTTVILNGTGTYTGGTSINGVTLRGTAANSFGNGDITSSGNSTLELRNANSAASNTLNVNTAGAVTLNLRNNTDNTSFAMSQINVEAGRTLVVDVDRVNAGGGSGNTLVLNAPVDFAGTGTLRLSNGNDYNTVIDSAGGGITTTSGTLTINMSNSTTSGHTGTVEIKDVISGGANLTLSGTTDFTGTLILSAANTYTGTTNITRQAGSTQLGINDAIPRGAGKGNFTMSPANGTATLDLNGFNQTVNGFSSSNAGNSVIDNTAGGTSTLTIGDDNSGGTFRGTIQNTGGAISLTKIGTAGVTLTGTNTYTGATLVSAGTLVVNGSIANSSLTTVNGNLRGIGTVGDILLNSGGIIDAASPTTAGTLSTGTITIVDGRLQFDIGGAGAGQYDQLNASGTIDLGAGGSAAKLVLDAISGYNATLNDAFTLVSNDLVDAITGEFAKVTTAGTNVVTISGVDYVQNVLGSNYYGRINYAGESTDAATLATAGNDIVLKIVTPEITVTEGATTLTDNGGYDFGDVDKVIPAIPVTKTFTIKNDGEVDLMNIAITALNGVAAGDYSLNTTGTATNLIPGASTTFTVTFDPQRIGTRNAYFSITSNDLDEATFDIPLTGVGSVARDLIADGPAPTDSWALTYSGVDAPATLRNSVANAVVVQHSTTADEAVAVFATGYTTNAAGNKDIYVMKYDPNSGADAWAAPVIIDGGVGRDDETLAIAVDGTGHVVVAGYQTVDLGNQDVYVAKFDGANGNLLWSRTYSGAGGGNDAAVSLALDPSGNVAVAGYGRNASANQDVFMARYLADGTEVFSYLIDGGASRTDGANTVATDAAGNVYAAGYRNVAAGNKDCYILAMDSTGGFLWEQTIGGTSVSTGSDDEVYSMALDATGNPVLGGTMYNSTGYDLFAAKLDAVSGAVTWQRSEDPYGFNDSYRNVLVDRNGNIVMAGVSHVTATTTERYVSKYTTNGVLVWNARLNSSNDTTGNLWTGGIALDGEENVVVTGYTVSGSTRDVYTAKLKGRDGSQLWERTYDGGVAGGADDEGRAVASSLDGYVYVAGYVGVDGGTRAALLKHYKPLIAPVQMPQTITFPALAEQGVGGQVQLVATATSGLRVRFNVISGPGTLSGADNDLLTITGLGTVVVRASQTGNFEWAQAANVEQTLDITKQAQTITFTLPASTYYTNVVALGATASSGLAVSYSVVSDPGGVANIVGSDLSFSGPGFVTVRASQAGNGTFVAAPNVDVVIEATNTPPVIFPSDIAQRWANTFAGTGAGAARAVALKPASGAATAAVITGYTTTAGGGRDIYTAQYNASGGLDWQATYTGAGVLADEGVAVTVDAAGNVYVAGYTTISGAGTDVIVIKYNSTGAEQWVRTFAGSTATGADAATSLALVGSDVVVGGYLTNATRDFFAARITGANAVTWQSSYDAGTIEGSTSKADTANKVAVDSSENIALVGNSASSSNNIDDIWTVKLDGATGTRQWHKRYNGTLNREDRGNGVGFDNVGNVLITGWTNGQASSQTYDIYTAKYAAADGALVWQTTYNGPNSLNDSSRDMKVDSQGSVIVVGVSNNPQGNQDMWTGKFNGQTGALVWEMVYNNNRNDVGLSVSLDPNGNPVVTGSSADVFGSVDIYTVKYSNANGTPVWDLPGFQRYEAINGRSDAPAMVAADGAGSVYVAGHHANSSGVTEALLVRYAPATVLPPPPLPPPPAFGEEEVFAAAPPPALQLFLNVEHGDLAHFGAEFSDAEGNDTVDFTATINGSPGGVLDVDAPAGRFTWEHDTSSIAPGLHEVVITATDTAGASSSVNLSVTVESNHPDRTWRWENFGSTVATGNAADDADPDGDGLSNLAEFAFGLNPTRAGNDVGTRAEAATEVGSGMRAVFRRRKDHATAGIDYVVEFSSNLGDWTPSTAIPELIADEGILERVGLVFPVLPNGKQSRFFRIQVQQQNAPSQ